RIDAEVAGPRDIRKHGAAAVRLDPDEAVLFADVEGSRAGRQPGRSGAFAVAAGVVLPPVIAALDAVADDRAGRELEAAVRAGLGHGPKPAAPRPRNTA